MTTALPFPPYEKIAESLAAWLGDDEPAFRARQKPSTQPAAPAD